MPHEPKVGELPALTSIPMQLLVDAMMLVDPPPIEVDGVVRVFRNPRAADVLTRLSAIVREMVAAQQSAEREARKDEARWISVDERLPNDWGSTLIWLTGRDGGTDVAWFQFKDGGSDGLKAGKWYDDGEFEVWGVTHWMPLPARPLQAEQPEGS